jgi:hypothetical protein
MFTLFSVFQLFGGLSLALAGFSYGLHIFSWPGAVVGTVVGFFVGSILGRIPFAIAFAFLRRSLTRTNTDVLKTRLQREYYISHYILAELAIRHEAIQPFRDYVSDLLRSDDPDRRRHGHITAQIWFPDLVDPSATANRLSSPQSR